MEFEQRLAVVTGATGGIGRAITEKLLVHGARVIGTGTGVDGDVPAGCEYHQVDFTQPLHVESFVDSLKQMQPDILINNAGINKLGEFSDIPWADFAEVQHVNLTVPFLLCQAVLPGMREKLWGRIVNITSIWSQVSKSGRASYTTSKFALDGLTTSLAIEAAPFNVLANCVAPGFIQTELTESTLGPEGIAEMSKVVPLGRLGEPEEIAAFVAWLVSPENTYLTGQNIAIDGGFTRV